MDLEDNRKFKKLITHMHFLENLSANIHQIKEEPKIYQFINSQFRKTKKYTVGLLK